MKAFLVAAKSIQPVRHTERSTWHATSLTTMYNYVQLCATMAIVTITTWNSSAWFQGIQHHEWGTTRLTRYEFAGWYSHITLHHQHPGDLYANQT